MSADRRYIPIAGPDPASLPDAGAITPAVQVATRPERPTAMSSLVASARRLTESDLRNQRGVTRPLSDAWQADAWEMYDLVGEMRFLVNILASQGAKARFYVGKLADDPRDPPAPAEDDRLTAVLEAIGDGPSGLSQLMKRLLMNLQVPGDGWLVGVPESMMPQNRPADTRDEPATPGIPLADTNLDDLEWRMLSISEVTASNGKVTLKFGDGKGDSVVASPDDVYMIRVWNPHPNKSWEADSPTRSALPVLRELVGLTMHISAQIDSRLAGAGVLLVPASAARAAKAQAGLPDDSEESPFTESMIEAMITPISDRSNASAYVPLVWEVPDDAVEKFKYMDFSKGLDEQAKSMRDESIRRYALSADAPPELLLGVGGMNHWGAWLVQEDTVRAHLEPPLALVCDSVTTQYLRPVMKELGGYSDEDIENYVVWYDVEHLIVRPNRPADATSLHEQGVISDGALRDAHGFSEDDAPESSLLPEAERTAYEMVRANPALMANPGLEVIVEQLRALLAGKTPPPVETPEPEVETAPEPEDDTSSDGGPPREIAEPTPGEPDLAADLMLTR